VGLVSLGIEKSLEFLRTGKLDLAKPAYGVSLNFHSLILAQGANCRRMNKREVERLTIALRLLVEQAGLIG
jgi:hypothetical protein